MVDVILGLQWGDEGKGKIVDYFATEYDVVARFQGGPNAGHTLYINGQKVVLHQVPSGIMHPEKINLIGNGVVLDVTTFKLECETLGKHGIDYKKNIYISDRTHLILPTHKALDKASELAKGDGKIGSTLKGIAPAYMDKTGRNGLRVGDLFSPDFEKNYQKLVAKHRQLLQNDGFNEDISQWEKDFFEAVSFIKSFQIVSGEYFVNELLHAGKKVLAEGAQGSMLDIDFGTYPYVTSSTTISAGVCSGLGIAPQKINEVLGVTKAYCTRVGGGPFPTELHDATGDKIRDLGGEYGSTTGRPRRVGWIDLVALKYASMINGVTKLVMTKADILDDFEQLKACNAYKIDGITTQQVPYQMAGLQIEPVYEVYDGWKTNISEIKNYYDLPINLKEYVNALGKFIKVPFSHISTGPERDQLVSIKL